MKNMLNKRNIYITAIIGSISVALLAVVMFVIGSQAILAFEGPATSAGEGTGAIGVDGNNNLSIGTSNVLADTKLLIVGSSTDSAYFAIRVRDKQAGPLFVVRNDGKVVIGTASFPPVASSTRLRVNGAIESQTGGFIFPDGTVQTTAGGGSVTSTPAGYVTPGEFNSVAGTGGNYSFPASVGIGTASPGAPLDVVGSGNSAIRMTDNSDSEAWTLGISPNGSLQFQDDGAVKFTFEDVTGNLGIGTASPSQKLEVQDSTADSNPSIEIENDAQRWVLQTQGTGGDRFRIIDNTGTATVPFQIFTDAPTNSFVINSSGNVGIGTASPGAKLQVEGDTNAYSSTDLSVNAALTLRNNQNTDNEAVGIFFNLHDVNPELKGVGILGVRQASTASDLSFITSSGSTPSEKVRITSAGNVGIGTASPEGTLSIKNDVNSLPANSGTTQTGLVQRWRGSGATTLDLGIYGTGGDVWLQAISNADLSSTRDILLQPNGGNVGIGTASPSQKLDVNGNFRVRSLTNCNTIDTDASGNLSCGTDAGVTGFGTTGFIPVFTASTNIGNSLHQSSGSKLGVGGAVDANLPLKVYGGAKINGSVLPDCNGCLGRDLGTSALNWDNVWANDFHGTYNDLAELYLSNDSLEPGEVVVKDTAIPGAWVRRAQPGEEPLLLGVISTNPAIIMGSDGIFIDEGYPVALSGRVPVKVTDERGEIAVGDKLTLSQTASGMATKAQPGDAILGMALEPWSGDGVGSVDMFVQYGHVKNEPLAERIGRVFDNWGIAIKNGIVSAKEFIADRISAGTVATDALEMRDTETGEIYCVQIAGGEFQKTLGACPN